MTTHIHGNQIGIINGAYTHPSASALNKLRLTPDSITTTEAHKMLTLLEQVGITTHDELDTLLSGLASVIDGCQGHELEEDGIDDDEATALIEVAHHYLTQDD